MSNNIQEQNPETFEHSFYAVKGADDKFFAGFNPAENSTIVVDDPRTAKWFNNRFNIKLRPGESLVELKVNPTKGVVSISAPFRPRKPKQPTMAIAK